MVPLYSRQTKKFKNQTSKFQNLGLVLYKMGLFPWPLKVTGPSFVIGNLVNTGLWRYFYNFGIFKTAYNCITQYYSTTQYIPPQLKYKQYVVVVKVQCQTSLNALLPSIYIVLCLTFINFNQNVVICRRKQSTFKARLKQDIDICIRA